VSLPTNQSNIEQNTPPSKAEYTQIVSDNEKQSLRSIANEELEIVITALETHISKAISRIRTCTEFKFPHTLKPDEINVFTNWEFDSDLANLMKDKLIEGFKEQQSFGDTASFLIDTLEEKKGGSWLCLIKPAQVQLGLSFHSTSQLVLSFKAFDIEYEVQINKTSN